MFIFTFLLFLHSTFCILRLHSNPHWSASGAIRPLIDCSMPNCLLIISLFFFFLSISLYQSQLCQHHKKSETHLQSNISPHPHLYLIIMFLKQIQICEHVWGRTWQGDHWKKSKRKSEEGKNELIVDPAGRESPIWVAGRVQADFLLLWQVLFQWWLLQLCCS